MKGSVTGRVIEWSQGETMAQVTEKFSAMDFTVFGLLLGISTVIGVFFAWKDRQNKDENNYALGGRVFSAWPVALSLTATSISAITMMGSPSEYYVYGSTFAWAYAADAISCIVAAVIFIPIYYNLGVTSVYEYLELRFGRMIRVCMTVTSLIQSVLYNGLVVFSPALAMNQVAGLDINFAILIVGFVCIFYTSIGGMKAVIWTDVWQSMWMLSGFVVIMSVACIDFGGISNIIDIAYAGNRLPKQYEIDPRYRNTFWSVLLGNCTGSTMATYVCQQYKVQRYLSCKSLKEARKSILYSIPVQVTISMLSVFVGFAAYAYFEHCDPWTNGWLSQRDQIIPYLSLYLFGSVAPGVAGIYMSAVFGASLSTCSSTINSCAVVIIEDLIKPFKKVQKGAVEKLSKILMLATGLTIIACAYMAKNFNGILEACTSINGCVSGPGLGVFIIGVFIPFVDELPSLVGLICGTILSCWVYIGSKLNPPGLEWTRPQHLDTSMCTNQTIIESEAIIIAVDLEVMEETTSSSGLFGLYSISYCYLGSLGMLTTVTVGVTIAMIRNKVCYGSVWESNKKPLDGTTYFNQYNDKQVHIVENDYMKSSHPRRNLSDSIGLDSKSETSSSDESKTDGSEAALLS